VIYSTANDPTTTTPAAISDDGAGLKPEQHIPQYFETLYRAWGRQHWWPAQTAFEVIVGAYLTQNTSWTNAEYALASLRRERLLSASGIRRVPLARLERLIRSAGYFRQKAQRLKTFVRFLDDLYRGSLARMFAEPTAKLRDELLALNGVGPETADSILLYAGNHPVFVVDAYTRRILERHGLIAAHASYEEIRQMFERALGAVVEKHPEYATELAQGTNIGPRGSSHSPSRMSTGSRTPAAQVFNEMHGLIVGVGKHYCKKSQPACEQCPLKNFLPDAQ
jgi:endonuclease III related protein